MARTHNQAAAKAALIDATSTRSPYELGLHLRNRPCHDRLSTALYDQQVSLYVSVLDVGVAQGHFALLMPALDVAQTLVALEDAYGLHIISRNYSLPIPRAVELMRSCAGTVTQCADLAAADEEHP